MLLLEPLGKGIGLFLLRVFSSLRNLKAEALKVRMKLKKQLESSEVDTSKEEPNHPGLGFRV